MKAATGLDIEPYFSTNYTALIEAMRRYQDELSSWKPPERSTD